MPCPYPLKGDTFVYPLGSRKMFSHDPPMIAAPSNETQEMRREL
jgi:hypothetical protein